MSYDFGSWYVTSWGWAGDDRIWRVYVDDTDDDADEDILIGEFVGEGRGLDVDWVVELGLAMIEFCYGRVS